jgi:hypothetical protein
LLGSPLLLLFLLTFASGAAVEEPPLIKQPLAAKCCCHANVFVDFNTWHLFMNLANAIINGEKMLTKEEEQNFEVSMRYRLRKAIFNVNTACHNLLWFVQMEEIPSSDPWDSATLANRTEVQDKFIWTIDDEDTEEF